MNAPLINLLHFLSHTQRAADMVTAMAEEEEVTVIVMHPVAITRMLLHPNTHMVTSILPMTEMFPAGRHHLIRWPHRDPDQMTPALKRRWPSCPPSR